MRRCCSCRISVSHGSFKFEIKFESEFEILMRSRNALRMVPLHSTTGWSIVRYVISQVATIQVLVQWFWDIWRTTNLDTSFGKDLFKIGQPRLVYKDTSVTGNLERRNRLNKKSNRLFNTKCDVSQINMNFPKTRHFEFQEKHTQSYAGIKLRFKVYKYICFTSLATLYNHFILLSIVEKTGEVLSKKKKETIPLPEAAVLKLEQRLVDNLDLFPFCLHLYSSAWIAQEPDDHLPKLVLLHEFERMKVSLPRSPLV